MTLLFAALAIFLAIALALLLAPVWRENRRMALLMAAATIAGSGGLYALTGSPRVVPLVAAHNAHNALLREKIRTHSATIAREPKNLEAWLFLAQALEDSGDYRAAAEGFKQAVLLSKGNPQIVVAYAQALVLEAGGTVTPQAKKSIDIALMIDKDLPLARYYHALWLLQENRQAEAMQAMKTLYASLPADSALKQKIDAQIGR